MCLALAHVVRGREDREDRGDWEFDRGVRKVFEIAVLLDLMATDDAAETVFLEELLDRREAVLVAAVAVRVEREVDALPLLERSGGALLVVELRHRVRPDDVPHVRLLRDLAEPIGRSDVRKACELGPDSAVDAEAVTVRSVVDDGCDGKGVEQLVELVIDLSVIFVHALFEECHVFAHQPRLVIPFVGSFQDGGKDLRETHPRRRRMPSGKRIFIAQR